MKKKKVISLIILFIAIILSITFTSAYFSTNSNIVNTYKTEDYKFNINGSGGVFGNNVVVVSNGTTTLPTPTRNGYTFLGFSETPSGSVKYSTSISNVENINDKTLYAKWEIITYDISYNLNGGSISNNKTSYNVEENFTLPNPTKTGYTFTGWTGSNGSTPQKDLTISKGTTNNLSYAANWQVNSYTVDVNPIISGTTYSSGKSGFTFNVYINGELKASNVIDWCNEVNYGSTVRVVANSKNGYSLSNNDVTATVGTNGLTFSPTWNLVTYSISYNLNGGTVSGQPTSYNTENTFTLPTPTRSGYNFTGWTGSNGSTPQTSVTVYAGASGNLSYTANWVKYNAYDYGGIYLVSYRDGANWGGTLTKFYNVGDTNVNSGNWIVTVDAYCTYITGTQYPNNYYTYQFYVYKANSTSELLATGSATAGSGINATATICW